MKSSIRQVMICKYLRKLYPVIPKIFAGEIQVPVQKSDIQFYNVQTQTPQYPPTSINNFTNDE